MTDQFTLIERLRAHSDCHSVDLGLLDEAADEIERLRGILRSLGHPALAESSDD